MPPPSLRVWAEEIEPPERLRLTWKWAEDADPPEDKTSELDAVVLALREAPGVEQADVGDEGVVVTIDPQQASRFALAQIIRAALGADVEAHRLEAPRSRVWAEDLAENRLRLTWEKPNDVPDDDPRRERRRVAAWLAVLPAVSLASPDGDGVTLRYDPAALDRSMLGDRVREALGVDAPLRERAEELMRRAPTYGNLARKLAMDKRISPLPDAARQAVANRGRGGVAGSVGRRTAMRFVPGVALISRVQALLPVLQELSTWSRESDPAVVDEHLAGVGLTREQLQRDTVTAHELRYYARDFASDTTAQITERAAEGAKQAVSSGRALIASVRESVEERTKPTEAAGEEDEDQKNEAKPQEI